MKKITILTMVLIVLISSIPALDLLPEQDLYQLSLSEDDKALYVHYLDNYRGLDQRRTMTILYNYLKISGNRDPLASTFLAEGIERTLETNDVFIIQRGDGLFVKESNLYFFWQMGLFWEMNDDYKKAKETYEVLKELFSEHQLEYSWMAKNSLKEIEGKIYKMDLYIDQH